MHFLGRLPNHLVLLLKAARKSSNYQPGVGPDGMPVAPWFNPAAFEFEYQQLPTDKILAYHRLVNWPDKEVVHPCFLHLLAFPLHLMLMSHQDFPFKLLGVVHITNQISQYRAYKLTDKMHFKCFIANILPHAKGWTFTIQTDVRIADELCWRSQSVNLYQDHHKQSSPAIQHHPRINQTAQVRQSWQLASQLGRRYAQVSGDFNPIHLSPLSAKLFGLKRHIAHGMWSKARCISALQQEYAQHFYAPFCVHAKFNKPIYLPAKVSFGCTEGKKVGSLANIDFSLGSQDDPACHLNGKLQTI